MLNDLKISKIFDEIVKDETQDYDLRAFLSDQCRYGQTVFVYYSETTELYDEYSSDCEEWLDEQVEETGLKPWDLFSEWDYAIDSDDNKFIVVVAMFEEYCCYLLEGLDQ